MRISCCYAGDAACASPIGADASLALTNAKRMPCWDECLPLWRICGYSFLQPALSRDPYSSLCAESCQGCVEKGNEITLKALQRNRCKPLEDAEPVPPVAADSSALAVGAG